MNLRLEVNVKPILAQLDAVSRKQAPFAIARALTAVGLEGQAAERDHFGHVFTLRRPDFIKREGVKLIGGIARKDRPSITFAVTDRASFLNLFEPGGTKRPTRAHSLAIPVDVRRSKKDIITKANRPRQLIARLGKRPGAGGVFKLDRPQGKLPAGIFQRTGRGGRDVKLLFAREPRAQIPRLLDFRATFESTVAARWDGAFTKAFADALRTAR